MKAFHNDPAIKAKYQARLAEHHRLDQIVQGIGFKNGRGCAVGCTLDNYDHKAYPHELGLPTWLAFLEDAIFEGLPVTKASQFAVDFIDTIPVGANVEKVQWQLSILRNMQLIDLLAGNTEPYALECVKAIEGVIASCYERITTMAAWPVPAAKSDHSVAESSAWTATESAAWVARKVEWSSGLTAWSFAASARAATESSAWMARAAAAARMAWEVTEETALATKEVTKLSAWAAREAAESNSLAAQAEKREGAELALAAHFEQEAEILIYLLKQA